MAKKKRKTKKATKKSPSEYQAAYTEKMYELGFVKVALWVPERDRDKIKQLADKLRNKYMAE